MSKIEVETKEPRIFQHPGSCFRILTMKGEKKILMGGDVHLYNTTLPLTLLHSNQIVVRES